MLRKQCDLQLAVGFFAPRGVGHLDRKRYNYSMKLCVSIMTILLALSSVAFSYPKHAFLDLPIAVSLGNPGRSYIQIRAPREGPTLSIGRAVTPSIDFVVRISAQAPFSPLLHTMLLKDLGPLSIALDVDYDGVCAMVGLFFGPVRIDWGRRIGHKEEKWAALTLSLEQRLSVIIGLEAMKKTISFLGGLRLFSTDGSWGGSALFHHRQLELSFGGYF